MKYKGKEYIEIPSAVALSQVGDALRSDSGGAVVFTTHSIAHLNVFLTCNHTSITPLKYAIKW